MLKPKQENRFEYKGFPCVVIFMPMGYRCGYVGLPKYNIYYGIQYGDIPIDCHCGLTYSNHKLYGQDDMNTWWIGFDCGHSCDGLDKEKFEEYYEDDLKGMSVNDYRNLIMGLYPMFKICSEYPVRTLEYVENECRKIVDQIIGVS